MITAKIDGSRCLSAFDHTFTRLLGSPFILKFQLLFSSGEKTNFFPDVGRCGLVSIQIVPSSHQVNQILSYCPPCGGDKIYIGLQQYNASPFHDSDLSFIGDNLWLVETGEEVSKV